MKPDLRAYLLGFEGARVFGPGPRELLERVESEGSLRAAAISMGMAYTKASRMVKTAEASFGFPLTERTIGGVGGGGSRLTTEARDLLDRYEAFEAACEDDLRRNFSECFSGFADVPRIGCVVMASGLGRRFRRAAGATDAEALPAADEDKLLRPLLGVPVLQHTLASLPADVLNVVVVTRSEAVEGLCEDLGVRCVRHAGAYQSDTIRQGLRALSGVPGCLFVPGDQPMVTEASVRALVGEYQLHPGSIVRLAWRGVPASPILWPSEDLPALAALEGDAGGSALLARREELGRRVRLVEATHELEVADVDTPDDLERIETLVRDWEELV